MELIDPATRIVANARGTPVVLGDGQGWLLADGGLCNALDAARDRIFDASVMAGVVDMADVRFAAWKMLEANYRLEVREGRELIFGADNAGLTGAVARALFGPTGRRRSYTAWASSSLRANGIDPVSLDGEDRADVLHHLVETGRAIPCDRFCEAIREAEAWAEIRSLAAPKPPVTS